ncbi:hypothetical protein EBZ35_02660 [bacterium]|nr:hypothetical protein [bacterium]
MSPMNRVPVVSVPGDGIGPAIMAAVQRVLDQARLPIEWHEHAMGRQASPDEIEATLSAFQTHRVMLKGPTETPVATQGQKSFNVTCRKGHGLYVNMRRSVSLHPIIPSSFPDQDITIFRENEEGLYAAIEHRPTMDGVQAMSLKSISGMYRIIRAAFEYAVMMGKSRVCCLHKGNILKMTEGTFLAVFQRVATDYPSIHATSQIIDDGMAKVATAPHHYEVVVTENLFGDILSDITTQLVGSLGMGGSANMGARAAMFEAIHGTAPDLVPGGALNPGPLDMANPSGLLQASLLMALHINPAWLPVVNHIQTAWAWVLEDGIHTPDIARGGNNPTTTQVVGTDAFTTAICERLSRLMAGETHRLTHLAHTLLAVPPHLDHAAWVRQRPYCPGAVSRRVVGVDMTLEWTGLEDLQAVLAARGWQVGLSGFALAQSVMDYAAWWHHGKGLSTEVPLLPPDVLHILYFQHQSVLVEMVALLWQRLLQATLVGVQPVTLSSRGQLLYPTVLDPDLSDQVVVRFHFNAPADPLPEWGLLLSSLQQAGFNVLGMQVLHVLDAIGPGFTDSYGDSTPSSSHRFFE